MERTNASDDGGQILFIDTVEETGDSILKDYKTKALSVEDTEFLLDQCVALGSKPWDKDGEPKHDELKALNKAIKDRKASK